MRVLARLAALVALLAAGAAVAAVAGSSLGVDVTGGAGDAPPTVRTVVAPASGPAAAALPRLRATPPPALEPSAGLAVADRGLRVSVAEPTLPAGEPATVRFRLLGGTARRVALTVVRRDGRYLQRPEARREGGGDWAADLRLARAGAYRLIADVDSGRRIVGIDLFAAGDFEPMPLPAPSRLATVDGYQVRLGGAGGTLRFTARRRGRPVRARPAGDLVAVRTGDLAYAASPPRRRALRFRVAFPGSGTYRMFVPFEHGGATHTAAFTYRGRSG